MLVIVLDLIFFRFLVEGRVLLSFVSWFISAFWLVSVYIHVFYGDGVCVFL